METTALLFAQDYAFANDVAKKLGLRAGTWRFIFELSDVWTRDRRIPVYVSFYKPMTPKQLEIMREIQTRFEDIMYVDL